MLTSGAILETLDKHADVIVATLKDAEKRRFIALLSAVTQAKDAQRREDAVDALHDFCRAVPALDELFNSVYRFYDGGNRGEHNFELSEAEQRLRLYANRLIKAAEKSLEQDRTPQEKTKEKKHDDSE